MRTFVQRSFSSCVRHVKRIALGVPEDKVCSMNISLRVLTEGPLYQWDGLFQEIVRVMKPGGAFEASYCLAPMSVCVNGC